MALTATIYHWIIELSDVDRSVYETLDLRVAMHPSETGPHLVTRVIAYARSFEEGITFSPGGVSGSNDPAVMVRDPSGVIQHWIDIGSPSADRIHRANKACDRVSIFTHHGAAQLQKEMTTREIHRLETVQAWSVPRVLVDKLATKLERTMKWTLLFTGGELYVTIGSETFSGAIEPVVLTELK